MVKGVRKVYVYPSISEWLKLIQWRLSCLYENSLYGLNSMQYLRAQVVSEPDQVSPYWHTLAALPRSSEPPVQVNSQVAP